MNVKKGQVLKVAGAATRRSKARSSRPEKASKTWTARNQCEPDCDPEMLTSVGSDRRIKKSTCTMRGTVTSIPQEEGSAKTSEVICKRRITDFRIDATRIEAYEASLAHLFPGKAGSNWNPSSVQQPHLAMVADATPAGGEGASILSPATAEIREDQDGIL